MDSQKLQAVRDEATTALVKAEERDRCLEAEQASIRAEQAALRLLLSALDGVESVAETGDPGMRRDAEVHLQGAIAIASGARGTLTRSAVSTTQRVSRILSEAAPLYLTPREILEALIAEGWTTASSTPIHVVRNTLADLAKRLPRVDRRVNDDGTTGYGWIAESLPLPTASGSE